MRGKREGSSASREAIILRGATENTNEGFVTIDEHHQVIIFNKAAEKIFGYSREEVLGNDLGLILSRECESGHKSAVSHFLRTGESKLIGHQTEFLTTRKDGRKSPFPFLFRFPRSKEKFTLPESLETFRKRRPFKNRSPNPNVWPPSVNWWRKSPMRLKIL